jgi:hypothetical protein
LTPTTVSAALLPASGQGLLGVALLGVLAVLLLFIGIGGIFMWRARSR